MSPNKKSNKKSSKTKLSLLPVTCQFCLGNANPVNYKDSDSLKTYLSPDGKILSRKISGNCGVHQKQVTLAIKRSREIGL